MRGDEEKVLVAGQLFGRVPANRHVLGHRVCLPLLVIFFLFRCGVSVAASEVCEACQTVIIGKLFLMEDEYHKKSRIYCEACTRIVTHCEVCRMPVHPKYGLHLPDKRAYCPEDMKTAVMKEDVAESLFCKARDEAISLLVHYRPLPKSSISIHLVTREEFNREYRRKPGIDNPSVLLGLTFSSQKEDEFTHDLYLLHGTPQNEFLAVCAHEYTHTWLNERSKITRELHKDTREAVCEFIAHKVMGKFGLVDEQKRITDSQYTHGQIDALLAAEKEYGFNHVIDWADNGVDSWLESTNLSRLFVLREEEPPPPLSLEWPTFVQTQVPDKLVLKGLSGSGVGRFALINNATLAAGEEARVRISNSNVLVRCLAISSNSVRIQVRGESAPRELLLEAKKRP